MAKKNNFTISKEQKITFRTDSINRYFSEVSKISRLTPERELELTVLAYNGDSEAKDELVKSNLRFVVSIAKTFAHNEEMLEDLINEGNIGLIKAASKFNPDNKIKFISYAVWWIRREMLIYMNQINKPIYIPANKVDDINKVRKVVSKIEQELCRQVTIDDLADYFDGDELESLQDAMILDTMDMKSLDFKIDDNDEDSCYYNVLHNEEMSTEKTMLDNDRKNIVTKALEILSDVEKSVIVQRYGLFGDTAGLTYNEISTKIGIPTSTVMNHEKKGLKKIKFRMNRSLSYR